MAKVGVVETVCLWLRGMLPRRKVWLDEADHVHVQHALGVLSCDGPFEVNYDNHVWASEASGGLHSSGPRIRRVGCSFVLVGRQFMRPIGFISFSLEAPIQTVPRGALSVFLKGPQKLFGTATGHIDATCVIAGLRRVLHKAKHKSNEDLWSQVALVPSGNARNVAHVRSHKPELLFVGITSPEAYLGNALADELAGNVADEVSVPVGESEYNKRMDSTVWAIRSRILVIAEHIGDDELYEIPRVEKPPVKESTNVRRHKIMLLRAKKSGHALERVHGRYICVSCCPGAKPMPPDKFAGVQCRNINMPPRGAHGTHRMASHLGGFDNVGLAAV